MRYVPCIVAVRDRGSVEVAWRERKARTSNPTALSIPAAEVVGQGSHEGEGLGCRAYCCMVAVETCLRGG